MGVRHVYVGCTWHGILQSAKPMPRTTSKAGGEEGSPSSPQPTSATLAHTREVLEPIEASQEVRHVGPFDQDTDRGGLGARDGAGLRHLRQLSGVEGGDATTALQVGAGEMATAEHPPCEIGSILGVPGVEPHTIGLLGGRCALLVHRLPVVEGDQGALDGTVVAREKGDDLGLGHGGTSDLG